MALKDRLRRLTTSTTSSTSSSQSSSTSPSTSPPSPGLSKTPSRLHLSKTWTFKGHGKSREDRLEDWRQCDELEWTTPSCRRAGRKDKGCQDGLRAFAWSYGNNNSSKSGDDRKGSGWSAVSPGQSRVSSVDDGAAQKTKA